MSELFKDMDVISAFSRAQAIAEGVLVDVTEMAKEVGFRCPVAVTSAVWTDCVKWTDEDSKRQVYQDQEGRLWDLVHMCLQTARNSKDADLFYFPLYRVPRGGRSMKAHLTRLKAVIGPGDNGEPVVTIQHPQED
jgi:hypothetical protein